MPCPLPGLGITPGNCMITAEAAWGGGVVTPCDAVAD